MDETVLKRLTEEHAVVMYRLAQAEDRIGHLEEKIEADLQRMNDTLQKLLVQAALTDFRSGIFGAIAGAIPGILMTLAIMMHWVHL